MIPAGGAEGILLAQGGRSGGYAFFIKDGKLRFIYNYLSRDLFDLISNIPVPRGEVTLRYEFEPTGNTNIAVGKGTSALGQIYINDILVGAMHMPHSVPIMFATEGLTCGYDGGDRVAPKEYADAFPFTGTLKRVTLALSGEFIPDLEQAIKIAMARQ
jgi:arylsulfatase